MQTAKNKKKGLVRYNMILAWSTSKRPFITQKLSFDAPIDFKAACKLAIKTKNTLWRAGGLDKSVVRILALGMDGVLDDYYREQAPYLLKNKAELKNQVKRFSKDGKDDSKAAKAGFKAKRVKLKDADFKFTINATDKSVKKKSRKVKAIVQDMPEPLYKATFSAKKVKKS